MTLGSLFDGIGGWQLAAIHNGVTPIWSSEIEAFPCAVTAKHFPETIQLGDITKLDGAELPPVDIICAGSPCQDLSVAGKQEGLKGARSGLFMDAIRIVRDMRRATGGKSPRYFVWENVPGAFSSNKGMDFRAVLEEITESEIPMPDNNKWADAGMVEWDGGSLSWRVLDAQYWGVPQRRRRIFLVADFTGQSAGEILFEREGLRGDSSESGEAREGFAAGVESGIGSASIVRMRAGCAGGGKGALVSREKSLSLLNHNEQVLFVPDKARSLTARNDGSPCVDRGPDVVATFQNTGRGWWNKSPIAQTLRTPCGGDSTKANLVAAGFKIGNSEAAHSIGYEVETSPTLSAMDSGNKPAVAVYGVGVENGKAGTLDASYYKGQGERQGTERTAVAVYDMTHADEVMRKVPDGRAPTLNARMGTGGNQVPVLAFDTTQVTSPWNYSHPKPGDPCHPLCAGAHVPAVAYSIAGNTIDRQLQNGGNGKGVLEEKSYTLNTVDRHAVCVGNGQLDQARLSDKVGALNCMHDQQCVMTYGIGRDAFNQGQNAKYNNMCIEKELQPTMVAKGAGAVAAVDERSNKTVRRLTPTECERLQGLEDGYTLIDDKTCSDTARYKALGNGMAMPCALYVMRRIVECCGGEKDEKTC